ncbi:MAG: hypothetical protein ACOH1T_04945 [Microbacteriaceae bacterium]
MTDIARMVAALGGMAQKQQLVARGARDLDLTRAVREGSVFRARQGWYSTRPEEDLGVRAVRVGGRLTGISAIKHYGGWVLDTHPLHVAVSANASRLRSHTNRFRRFQAGRGVVLHWESGAIAERGDAVAVSLRDALHRVILDEPFEQAVAALDWALRFGHIDEVDLAQIASRLPLYLRFIVDWVDASCDSLPESVSRTRFRLAGHRVESQRELPTGEVLDLVVDGQAGVDIDGREFHEGSFERDRNKDVTVNLDGLHAMRPSANMIFRNWDRFYASVCVALEMRGVPLPTKIQESGRYKRSRVHRTRQSPVAHDPQVLSFQNAGTGNSPPPPALNWT